MTGDGKLSGEDRALWNRVLKSVKPIHRPKPPAAPQAAEPAVSAPAPSPAKSAAKPARKATARATAPPYRPPVSAPKAKDAPGLAGLEPRHKRRLSRGHAEVEAHLDLHGMRQSTAFHTLIGFLRQAQARGAGTALVITGKGSGDDRRHGHHGHGAERGVLRRLVPQWLSRGEFRDLVIGFEPASRRHGGEGALYVRIRRRRQPQLE